MSKIKIMYKIIIYDFLSENNDIIEKDNLSIEINDDILFAELVEELVKMNNISIKSQIYIKDLKEKTWGKIVSAKFLNTIDGDSYHYRWFNYKLKDIQQTFGLFDNKIDIIIEGPGIGGYIDELEGIKFYINSNEKDRHEHDPHVHCKYSGEKTRIRIDNQEIMKGEKEFKNPKKTKVAKKWIKDNQEDLMKAYNTLNQIENNSIYLTAEI
ncbi:MAG: DUF4160 domain-containing protein [Bacilli bacterium]|nr:DUF4160 domain-containing protein [Bacilli bacterium]